MGGGTDGTLTGEGKSADWEVEEEAAVEEKFIRLGGGKHEKRWSSGLAATRCRGRGLMSN